ncbi:hypothetical protein PFISCL1PPCAC_26487 [Pristionchus fissidentatus]|uniref:Uncharacterized protein n=1 Tax=Pristionchus fissidentatus TaxID=1538716 RepID=A0AAV5WX37_9BILA|nr:hypothetical protein PFISCL1PPCAC_26487 [Pristionchus fissidentatus]
MTDFRSMIRMERNNCTTPLVDVHTWLIHTSELTISVLGLILNCIVTLLTHRAAPIPYAQRRQLCGLSLNYALLGAIQLSRNLFLLCSLHEPCLPETNTATCKLQEFPLLFCYIHGGILACIISTQMKKKYKESRRPVPYTWMCSIWQTLTACVCIAITLGFTAFDNEDGETKAMEQCSILLAIRDYQLVFVLITLLISLHAIAVVYITLYVNTHSTGCDKKTILSFCVRDVLIIETVAWQLGLLIAGAAVAYRNIWQDTCTQCVYLALELFFVFIPILISFAHPILLIWFVFPVRDSAVRLFPWLSSVLPEYALVPPPAPPRKKISRRNRKASKKEQEKITKFVEVKPVEV